MQVINFGGHTVVFNESKMEIEYNWYSMKYKDMISTLTASLLFSFSYASIARYRPSILNQLMNSRYNLIFDVFMKEADGHLLPSFRNLLYKEVIATKQIEYF